MLEYDEQEIRIAKIFSSNEIPDVTKETVEIFVHYIKENISPNLLLIGREDFPWEEYYTLGPGSAKEYKYLKKKQLSYSDQVEFISFDKFNYDGDWFIKVKRLSDKKVFISSLSWFKAIETGSKTGQILDDYSLWIVNWC